MGLGCGNPREIEIVGQGLPAAGSTHFAITEAGVGDESSDWDVAKDWFAPAQYEQNPHKID